MNKNLYFLITLLGGCLGIHKFICGKIGMGILYLCTFGLFGIGWFIDIISAASALSKPSHNNHQNDYIGSLYLEMNQQIISNEVIRKFSSTYYSGIKEIESMWSVMHNLKIFTGEKADIFIQKCQQNIFDLYAMLEANKRYGYDSLIPPHVPAYVRLAMLYEKQENYESAINICVEAIKAGAINDGNKGRMYGRLARLIRKSGIAVDEEILALSMKS